MPLGIVKKVRKSYVGTHRKGFGIIRQLGPRMPDVMFVPSALQGGLAFGAELLGKRVEFEIVLSGKGLRAENVRLA